MRPGHGPGCWRALLWINLQAAGYTAVDLVGTRPGGGCGVASWDGDNDGHGGCLAINTANQGLLTGWLTATNATFRTLARVAQALETDVWTLLRS